MSMALTHFSVGVAGTMVLLLLTGQATRRHADILPLLGGCWGMVPDLWRFTPLPKAVHSHPVANLFFGHYHLDMFLDPLDTHAAGALAVGGMVSIALVFSYVRHRARQSPAGRPATAHAGQSADD